MGGSQSVSVDRCDGLVAKPGEATDRVEVVVTWGLTVPHPRGNRVWDVPGVHALGARPDVKVVNHVPAENILLSAGDERLWACVQRRSRVSQRVR